MTSPSVASVGTYTTGTGNPQATPVPSGVVNGSFVMAILGDTQNTDPAAPTDFSDALVATGANPSTHQYSKFATGSDSGNYSIPTSGVGGDTITMRITGVDASPIHGTKSTPATGSGTTTHAVQIADAPTDCLLIWMVTTGSARTCTIPTNFVRRTPSANQRTHIATLEWAGGDTGSITGVLSLAVNHRATLLAIKSPAASGQNSGFLGLL